jgi:hypothetical protein
MTAKEIDVLRRYGAWIALGLKIARYKLDTGTKDMIGMVAREDGKLPVEYAKHNDFFKVYKNFVQLSKWCFDYMTDIGNFNRKYLNLETLGDGEFLRFYENFLIWKSEQEGKKIG